MGITAAYHQTVNSLGFSDTVRAIGLKVLDRLLAVGKHVAVTASDENEILFCRQIIAPRGWSNIAIDSDGNTTYIKLCQVNPHAVAFLAEEMESEAALNDLIERF